MTTELEKARTANKGEWSEIYTFFKIVDEKVLNSSDESLNAIPGQSVDIYKIIRGESINGTRAKKIYDLTLEKDRATIFAENGEILKVVELSQLRQGVKNILSAMEKGSGAFAIPEADSLMNEFLCSSIKASNTDKADIHLVIKDRHTPTEIESGFSIKSAYSAPSTLLNPSSHTTFLYEVVSESEKSEEPVKQDRVRDRIQAIYDSGHALKFIKTESPVFYKNLQLIDTVFPQIMAALLARYYRNSGGSIEELVRQLPEDSTLSQYDLSLAQIEFKVKLFLEAVALGMTPSQLWSGHADAQGGYIIVKENGELVCFHRYNREKFMDYLYKNTKLDTPSTSRYGFGTEETIDGQRMLKLNLQIRFK